MGDTRHDPERGCDIPSVAFRTHAQAFSLAAILAQVHLCGGQDCADVDGENKLPYVHSHPRGSVTRRLESMRLGL